MSINLDDIAASEPIDLDETDELVDPKVFMKASIKKMSKQIKELWMTVLWQKEDKVKMEDLMTDMIQ